MTDSNRPNILARPKLREDDVFPDAWLLRMQDTRPLHVEIDPRDHAALGARLVNAVERFERLERRRCWSLAGAFVFGLIIGALL
ncbi:hypothetical protein AADZ90_021235 [Aestuariibius sp. 2305UL40-4]|uniref:hypothetical protein n=1 Tax=Aestuariibius violaceus TaxID=3234132 RepID=UPI00345E7D28